MPIAPSLSRQLALWAWKTEAVLTGSLGERSVTAGGNERDGGPNKAMSVLAEH